LKNRSKTELIKQIERLVLNQKPDVTEEVCRNYLGGRSSALRYHGLKVPRQRDLLKQPLFDFEGLSDTDVLGLWDRVWKESDIAEVMALPLFYYGDKIRKKQDIDHIWSKIRSWVKRCDNWPHSDNLSFLYSHLLERRPKDIKPELQKWNRSSNPWKVRQSMVSLIYYNNLREKPPSFSFCKNMVTPNLSHTDYYVQKGLGWTLREMGVFYPERTYEFMLKHVSKISPTAFTTAIEKIPPSQKLNLKNIRKAKREKNRNG